MDITRRGAILAGFGVIPQRAGELILPSADPIQQALDHLDKPAFPDEPESVERGRWLARNMLTQYREYMEMMRDEPEPIDD